MDASVVPCVHHDPNAPRTVVLIGDSVGVQWLSAIKKLYRAPEWRLVVFTKSACALVDEDYHYAVAGGTYTVCREWRDRMLETLQDFRPEVIFVGSASTYPFNRTQWIEGTKRVLERLTAVADQVVVIPGTPLISFDGPSCLERWLKTHDYAATPSADACRERMTKRQPILVAGYLSQATDHFDNADVLNLIELVCPGGFCAARDDNGIAVYRDQRHLTNSFVKAQSGPIGEFLRQRIPGAHPDKR